MLKPAGPGISERGENGKTVKRDKMGGCQVSGIETLAIYEFTNLSFYQSTNLPIYQSINILIYQSTTDQRMDLPIKLSI